MAENRHLNMETDQYSMLSSPEIEKVRYKVGSKKLNDKFAESKYLAVRWHSPTTIRKSGEDQYTKKWIHWEMWKNYPSCHENKPCHSNYSLPKCIHCQNVCISGPFVLPSPYASVFVTKDEYFLVLLPLLCCTGHMPGSFSLSVQFLYLSPYMTASQNIFPEFAVSLLCFPLFETLK